MEEFNMPLGLIKINCRTCKGEKKVDAKCYDGFFSMPIEEAVLIEPSDVKVPCMDCKGRGYYEIKRL